jgi:hypothetical protein
MDVQMDGETADEKDDVKDISGVLGLFADLRLVDPSLFVNLVSGLSPHRTELNGRERLESQGRSVSWERSVAISGHV